MDEMLNQVATAKERNEIAIKRKLELQDTIVDIERDIAILDK